MFRLAVQLGYYNPDAMVAEGPASLIHEWLAYYDLEPFGEARADIRNAITAHTVASTMGKKPGGGEFKLEEFMPRFGQDAGRKSNQYTPAQAKGILKSIYGNHRKPGRKPHGKDR